jgi:hypothetical protein
MPSEAAPKALTVASGARCIATVALVISLLVAAVVGLGAFYASTEVRRGPSKHRRTAL